MTLQVRAFMKLFQLVTMHWSTGIVKCNSIETFDSYNGRYYLVSCISIIYAEAHDRVLYIFVGMSGGFPKPNVNCQF